MAPQKPKSAIKKDMIDWLDTNLTDIIADRYTIEKHQQNRIFSRALIVNYVKFLRENHDQKTKAELKELLCQASARFG